MKLKMGKLIIALILVFTMLSSLALTAFAAQTEDYGKGTITESDVLYVYNALYSGVAKDTPDTTINFSNSKSISKTEMEKGVSLFISDHPECFWFRNHYSYSTTGLNVTSITPTYSFTGSALATARAQLNSAVSEIMGGLPDGSNYDKALYLHDALAARVEYLQTGEHQTVYGALVSGKAVCAGYAAAYQMLLELAGITAWTVTGESRGIPHAWNALWLDENTCVYTDVTWDDQQSGLFHYYFNISKEEMALDHTADEHFVLPSCNHNNKSYFDINQTIVNDSTTVAELAAMFGPASDGKRSVVIYYDGSDLEQWRDQWLHSNAGSLYSALGGRSSASYLTSVLGKEVHITMTGTFVDTGYKVSINAGSNVTAYGSTVQNVKRGEAMSSVIIRANDGYYFPRGYSVSPVRGITVTRIDSKRVSVSGTPTADNIVIDLPAVSKMTREATPAVSFVATGYESGKLTGVESGMKYSTDGDNWTNVTSNADVTVKVGPGNIYIVKKGNGESTLDSDVQTIKVKRAATPTLTFTQPTEKGGNGRIETSEIHSYSTDGEEWISCTGALELPEGKYYVCVRENGTTLASAPREINLKYVDVNTDPTTPPVDDGGEEEPPTDDGAADGGENIPSDDSQNGGGSADGNGGNTDNGGSVTDNDANVTEPTEKPENEDKTDAAEKESEEKSQKSSPMCAMTLEGEGAVIVIALVALCLTLCALVRKKQRD